MNRIEKRLEELKQENRKISTVKRTEQKSIYYIYDSRNAGL